MSLWRALCALSNRLADRSSLAVRIASVSHSVADGQKATGTQFIGGSHGPSV